MISFPNVTFIFQDNSGFACAVNRGIRESSGRYIMLLNPDAELVDDSHLKALQLLSDRSEVAVVGPKIVDRYGIVQDSFREFMTPMVLARRTLERLITPDPGPRLMNGDYTTTHQVDWVSGACMLVKREYTGNVGLMDERYFMYVEDMDWCRAFANKGYQVWYLPDWRVKHDATRASSSRSSILNRFLWFHLISLSRYYLKWYLHKPHSQQRG
jgi:GT2 family glycosyltransferase